MYLQGGWRHGDVFFDSVWTMFWYINLPCIKQLDLVMFIQFSPKFPVVYVVCCSRNVDEGTGGMVLASLVGSGQVICKDFSTAGCTQIGTSSP